MRTLILSDVHLGNKHCSVPLLNEVLDTVQFDRLILNGDTLQSVNLRKMCGSHWALLDRFRRLAKERELVLIRGNHDHETDYNPSLNGQNPLLGTHAVLPGLLETPMLEEYAIEVGPRKYAILHGDRFDPTLRYPMMTDVACFCYQLTTKINKKLAKWLKKKSKRWSGVLRLVREHSITLARQRNLDGIITGHTHFSEDSYDGDTHYVNSGCWTEYPCSYLTVDGGAITLHHQTD
ncbi:MAG: metallophosphoesterase family protein [Gemmataceae bacterium]